MNKPGTKISKLLNPKQHFNKYTWYDTHTNWYMHPRFLPFLVVTCNRGCWLQNWKNEHEENQMYLRLEEDRNEPWLSTKESSKRGGSVTVRPVALVGGESEREKERPPVLLSEATRREEKRSKRRRVFLGFGQLEFRKGSRTEFGSPPVSLI